MRFSLSLELSGFCYSLFGLYSYECLLVV